MLKLLVIIWTLVAVVLHFSEIGAFGNWEVTDWPWNWSCICIFYWWLFIQIILSFIVAALKVKAQKEWDNAPEWYKHFTKRPE